MPNPIATSLKELSLGEPTTFRNLSIFPLIAPIDTLPGYVPLADALHSGQAKVTEVSAAGQVPELLLDNGSEKRVLLLDGDELVGAKQNRVLNITILVGAHRKVVIPVSCVERGRWHARSAEFKSEDRMMFARGRAEKMRTVTQSMRATGTRRSDQGAVWASVSEKSSRFQAEAPTEAMSDVYAHVSQDTSAFREAFRAGPRQVGGVFAIDGRPAGVELFDAPATFASTLGRLVESYALDAIETQAASPATASREAADQLLHRASAAAATTMKAVGEGEDVRLEAPGLVGQALLVDGNVIHLSALALAREGGHSERASDRARRISSRTRS